MKRQNTDEFAQKALGVQRQLFAYIVTMVPNLIDAEDVLQETNVVLWYKREEYDPALPILPWARKIAYFQVLAIRKRQTRDRLRFDGALLDQLASSDESQAIASIQQQAVLSDCVTKLTPEDQRLLRDRYTHSRTAAEIGERLGRSANAIQQAMRRIRLALLRCVGDASSMESR